MLTTTSAAFAKNSVTCASECDGVETGQEEADLGLETKGARREGGRGDGAGRERGKGFFYFFIINLQLM